MENDRIWILLTRKLSGEATTTELDELESLIGGHPGFEKLVSAVSDSWIAGTPTDTEFLEATYLVHLQRMKARGYALGENEQVLEPVQVVHTVPGKAKFHWKEVLLSAMVLVLVTAGLLIIKKPMEVTILPAKEEIGIVSTQNGARTKLMLPDGSGVWLNAGSKLNYKKTFDDKIREVELTGEAFFDVVKDPERPFIIHTSKMDVKVLGTQFNVKAYELDKNFETSLVKGSVEISVLADPEKKYLLKPNQKLVLAKDMVASGIAGEKNNVAGVQIRELTYLAGTNADIESSWTRNILSFEDEPFSEVAKKMERWYDVKFEFKDKRWENEYLKGSFEKESLDQAMNALRFSFGFNFSIKDKIISIY